MGEDRFRRPAVDPRNGLDGPGLREQHELIAAHSEDLPVRPWIVALTANAFPEDRERCLASGMDDYISKPIQENRLVKALARFAREHQP